LELSHLLTLLTLGALFGFANAVQSRLVNNGTKRRFPDWLVAGSVFIVTITYGMAMRGVATSTAFETILAYGLGQACGVIAGTHFATRHGERREWRVAPRHGDDCQMCAFVERDNIAPYLLSACSSS
jgi:hypothetical protein